MMEIDYIGFLRSKMVIAKKTGIAIDPGEISPILKPHQRDAVLWAAAGGRRAIFAAFGLGKTIMQLEWCRLVHEKKGGKAVIEAICKATDGSILLSGTIGGSTLQYTPEAFDIGVITVKAGKKALHLHTMNEYYGGRGRRRRARRIKDEGDNNTEHAENPVAAEKNISNHRARQDDTKIKNRNRAAVHRLALQRAGK